MMNNQKRTGWPKVMSPDGGTLRDATPAEADVINGNFPTWLAMSKAEQQPRNIGNFIGRISQLTEESGANSSYGKRRDGGVVYATPIGVRESAFTTDDAYLFRAIYTAASPARIRQQPINRVPVVREDDSKASENMESELVEETKPGKLEKFRDMISGHKRITASIATLAVGLTGVFVYQIQGPGETADNRSDNTNEMVEMSNVVPEILDTNEPEKVFSLEQLPSRIPVFKVSSVATASTMWNFKKGTEFDATTAIGADTGDPGFSFETSPEVEFLISLPWTDGGENNAIDELTGEEDTHRVIRINMDKIIVEALVHPDSIDDTKQVNFFALPASERRAALMAEGFTGEEVNEMFLIYENNKQHAESQLISLIIKNALIDPGIREELIIQAKARIIDELGLRDPTKFKVMIENPDKFAQADAVANRFLESVGVDHNHVRIEISDDHPPEIKTEVISKVKADEE